MKNKALYYILSLTWGLPLSLCGLICACALILTGHKPKRWGGCLYFNVGENWGGVNMGIVFLTDNNDSVHTKNHEFGHSIQNCYWGFLMPLVIGLPSMLRSWYRRFRTWRGLPNNTPYDAIWFEGQATKWGTENLKYWQ